ncbi:YwhD family protein [Amphibacillus marinus]|uniref:YwhD family protein n=1 Tax=Amphibacillus marinus TaxID=872970 RepID=A0A1H8MZ79_9BACI|nr:YwhD family protein [Amphibacillus marinus]SEO22590.1 YwhD family protein [Amphibacillus marinus]
MTEKKPRQQFTIMKDDSTDGHGGYGVGSISLENISPVIIDPNESRAFIDMSAMHARSEVERRVKFIPHKEQVPNGLLYWIVWVTVERGEQGPYYHGVAASEIRVDRPNRIAYKSMPEHVTHMEKSLKGEIVVEHMDAKSLQLLRDFLKNFNSEMWENADPAVRSALTS